MPTSSYNDTSRYADTSGGLGARTKLAAKLKEAADPHTQSENVVRAKAKTVEISREKEKKFDKIEENPFFQIAKSKAVANVKRDEMIKLLSYDVTKTVEENSALTKAYMLFLDYMEEQSILASKENLAGQNAKVMAELKQVIDEFSNGIVNFKEEIAPFTRRLESIYNIRLSGNAVALLEEIIQDKRAVEEGKALLGQKTSDLEAQTTKLARLSDEIFEQKQQIAALNEDYVFGVELFGLWGKSKRKAKHLEEDLASKTIDSTELGSAVEALKSEIDETKRLIGEPRDTQFGELKDDKATLQEMLDISNEDHIRAHESLKDRTLGFIETSETRIDSVLSNVEDVNALTSKTHRKNSTMVLVSAIMNDAVTQAKANNQSTLTTFEPPAEGVTEDEIAKAEREESRLAVLRHIKSVSLADSATTSLRNQVTVTNDQLNALLQANEERIRATKQLRTSGIAGMSAEMAVTMTALADAANAEAIHMSQTMVDAMRKTVIDIRSKEVMRQASEMGIRNQQLAELIVATTQADQIAKIGIEEQRKGLVEINKHLANVTNVTANLQETLKASEAVYAEAGQIAADELEHEGFRPSPANDDVPHARHKAASKGGPSADLFG